MGQTQRLRSLGGIERMTGLATRGQPEGKQRHSLLPQEAQHRLVAIPPAAAVAPSQPDRGPGRVRQDAQAPPQPLVGLRADRIGAAPQHRRTGRDAGEQVQHL